METGSVFDKAKSRRKSVSDENVKDYHHDVLLANNGAHIQVY